MERIGVAVLIFSVLYLKTSAEGHNEDIFAMTGCEVSFHWTLGNKSIETIHAMVYHSSNTVAQLTFGVCEPKDNLSAYCNISNDGDEWLLSLTMFNVTEHTSGDYSLWFLGLHPPMNNGSKRLILIGKPNILEVRKPILHQQFEMTCNTTFGLDCFIYRWKINGSEITPVSNAKTRTISSLLMADNFSEVTCQICLNETASGFSSVICKHDCCSAVSDPYEMKAFYGPENILLSLNKSHIYLEENKPFTMECSAKCSPECIYAWRVNRFLEGKELVITSRKLVITSFEPRLAGQYTCYVTNQEINITLKSSPIMLQHNQGSKLTEETPGDAYIPMIGMGLVGFAVMLSVIGILLANQWRRSLCNKTDSQILNHPVVHPRIPTNGEMSQGISRIQNRPLPVPNTHGTTSKRRYRPPYLNHKRYSRSLHDLLDSTQDSLRGGLSLQVLYSPSNIMRKSHKNGTQVNDLIKKRWFSNCDENQLGEISELEKGFTTDALYAKVQKDKKSNRSEHIVQATCESIDSIRNESFEEEPQEDLYNTIYEDDLTVYDAARKNNTTHNSNEELRHENYDYADCLFCEQSC